MTKFFFKFKNPIFDPFHQFCVPKKVFQNIRLCQAQLQQGL